MYYLCSSALRSNPSADQQLPELINLLQLNTQQQALLQHMEPVDKEGHVTASNCFAAWFAALATLREPGQLNFQLTDDYRITDISTRFARYENALYLYFKVHSRNAPQTEEELVAERDAVHACMQERFGQKLNFDFYVTSKVAEFRELLRLQPITPLFETNESVPAAIQSAYGNDVQGKGYQRHHRLSYANEYGQTQTAQGKNAFVREHASIFKLEGAVTIDGSDPANGRNHFYDMLHTELVFFHRTQAMEEKLDSTYQRIDFLKELIHVLEDKWIRIRSFFSISPKFALTKRSSSAHLFLNLLETKGQLLALQNSIESSMGREHRDMQERYERLHFNAIGNGSEGEQQYLHLLHNEVDRSFRAYSNHLDSLGRSTSRLVEGIEQLRGDFDSNTNIILQLLVLTLSVVLVFWGVVALGLDKGIHVASQQSLDAFSMVGIGLLALFGVLGLYGLIASLFMAGATRVMKRSANSVIELSLECDDDAGQGVKSNVKTLVERHLAHLSKAQKKRKKKHHGQLFAINQMLEVIIMILPAVTLRHMDVETAKGVIEHAKRTLGIKRQ